MLVSWMCIYVQTYQVVYIKYVQVCVSQSYHSKVILKNRLSSMGMQHIKKQTQNDIENVSILKQFGGLRKPESDANI